MFKKSKKKDKDDPFNKFKKISKIFVFLSILLLLLVIIVAAGIIINEMNNDWATLSLENWILLSIFLIVQTQPLLTCKPPYSLNPFKNF